MTSSPLSATVADVLTPHPWIARVDAGDEALRLVVADEALSTVRRTDDAAELGGLVAEHLAHWAEVYDWTYTSAPAADGTAELAGWRATDTGAPLPPDHMAEWVDRTVELVLAQHPERVLELGCGTGLLMRRLLPHVSSYIGTDVSQEVIDRHTAEGLTAAQFVRAGAHQIRDDRVQHAVDRAGAAPDCILLNSVTQCFGDYSYLAAVVLDALAVVAPGGTVIIGDVRDSRRLLEYSRWAEQATGPKPADDDLEARAAARAAADTEMCLDPVTLAGLAQTSGRSVSTLAHAKTLTLDSELNRYRFDAVLRVDAEPGPAAEHVAWSELSPHTSDGDLEASLDALHRRLEAGPVVVTGIDRRVPAADLRRAAGGLDAVVLVDESDPHALAVACPPAAGAVTLAAAGLVHEPLGAFARSRVTEVARRLLRQAGLPLPRRIDVVLPAGRALNVPAVQRWHERVDRAGRVAVSGTPAPVADAALVRVPRAVTTLESIALRSLCAFLRSAGIGPGTANSIDALFTALRVAPRHQWIVRRWIRVLCDEGSCQRIDEDHFVLTEDGTTDPAPDHRELTRACRALGYPAQMADFYAEAVAALGPLLRDEISAQSLLFPDGELTTSLGKDESNISNRYLHGCVAAALADNADTRPRPLRILELGGGAGGGTRSALAALPEDGVDYLFTDISRFFTDAAENRFGDRRGFRTAVVDIDRPLTEQGIAPGSVDVVVAANVLHCAQNVERSVAAFGEVLVPGGTAVVVEAVREHCLVLLTMQFLLSGRPGTPHPGAGDSRSDSGSVFCSAVDIRAALAATGQHVVMELPGTGTPLAAPDQRLFIARQLRP